MIFGSRVEAFLKMYPPLQEEMVHWSKRVSLLDLICFTPPYKFPEFFDLGW